ncbi:MAG TPA: hypothetical protein DEB39_02830 [Planctomycetaceae bacterium]|nr:hypothetical protein [Planctomycetaceae bacterium]
MVRAGTAQCEPGTMFPDSFTPLHRQCAAFLCRLWYSSIKQRGDKTKGRFLRILRRGAGFLSRNPVESAPVGLWTEAPREVPCSGTESACSGVRFAVEDRLLKTDYRQGACASLIGRCPPSVFPFP